MNLKIRYVLLLWLAVFTTGYATAQDTLFNPLTYQSQVTDTFFGTPVADPYRWLEDINSDSTRQWLKAQRKITRAARSKFTLKFMSIYTTLDEGYRFSPGRIFKQGPYYFQLASIALNRPPVVLYSTKEEDFDVAYDANKLTGKAVNYIVDYELAPDSQHLAVQVSKEGGDWREIHVCNLKKKAEPIEVIKWVRFSNLEWYKDGFFYSRFEKVADDSLHVAANKGQQLLYHKLGTNTDKDLLIHVIPDKANSVFKFHLSPDKRYLIFYSAASIKGRMCSIVSYRDLNDGIFAEQKLLIATPINSQFRYEVVDVIDSFFVIKTDYNSPTGYVFKIHRDSTNDAVVVIPPYKEILVEAEHINHKLLCLYAHQGMYKAVAFDYAGKPLSVLNFDTGTVINGFYGDKDDTVAYFRQNGFYYPPVLCSLDLKRNKYDPIKDTYTNFTPSEFVTKLVNYKSNDGTVVPMYLTYRKTTNLKKQNPVLLYGYGGFGISVSPFYDYAHVLFCASGGVLAVPLIRGGGENGKQWHQLGKGMYKQNSFDDFAAAAQYLIDNNYTTADKLAIKGASNGGLLVAAMLTQHPELFKAAVAEVGVYDMLRYQLYTGGRFWLSEYGNINDSAQFANLLSYSPYHNLKAGVNYPATMIVTAENDERVSPLHSYKLLAQMQQVSANKEPHILYFEEDSGHSGGITFNSHVDQQAVIWSFIFKYLGVTAVSSF